MKKILPGLCALACLLVCAPPAPALGPGVTLRVEGKTANVVPSMHVSLDALGYFPDGVHPCSGISFGEALARGLGKDEWSFRYDESLGTYFLTAIRGYAPSGNDHFAFWLHHRYSPRRLCDDVNLPQSDAEMLILVDHCEGSAPACDTPTVLPLALDVPSTVTPGMPFTVTVTRYAADGSSAPVAGATVAGATTDPAGKATVTVAQPGQASLRAGKDGFAGVDATTCATTGTDGFCGTTKAPDPPPPPPPLPTPSDTKAPVGRIASPREQQHFAKGKGPRALRGTVDADPSGLRDIALRLTRTDHGRCAAYDGSRERLVKVSRCGASHGRFFSSGNRADWSYALPSRLPRGRYVLDVQVTDNAGNVDRTRQRGRNRIVFAVR